MSDVRDILELNEQPQTSKQNKKKKMKRFIEPIKRPQGMHREVWGLIFKDDCDQPSLMPAEEPKLYKHPKAKLRYGVRKWHWTGFKNPARTDQATFYHWRCVNEDPSKEYAFAKYNKQISLPTYTDAEYAQNLNSDENWTKDETDYLFDLCKRYDLRFFVIHDRWDHEKFPGQKKRTLDELKDRYYKVTGILQKLKSNVDESQIYVFDLEHEQKRREQLEKLFNRTKEQVDEEQYLMEELKKIEIRKKERERKQQDVNKLLTAVVDLENSNRSITVKNKNDRNIINQLVSSISSSGVNNENLAAPVTNENRKIKQRKVSATQSDTVTAIGTQNKLTIQTPTQSISGASNLNNSAENAGLLSPSGSTLSSSHDTRNPKKSIIFKAVVETTGIKFPDNKVAGVSLRSYKMKLPPSVGLKKTKAIEQLLEELQIDSKPIATEAICEQFNELRSDIVLLYELQQALTNCEYELQTFRHRYESILPLKNIDMSLFETTTVSSATTTLSNVLATNTPQKRISELFDVSTTPTGPLERRRKAALNQTNLIKRLRGRNTNAI